jgi:hypothetical protein
VAAKSVMRGGALNLGAFFFSARMTSEMANNPTIYTIAFMANPSRGKLTMKRAECMPAN